MQLNADDEIIWLFLSFVLYQIIVANVFLLFKRI